MQIDVRKHPLLLLLTVLVLLLLILALCFGNTLRIQLEKQVYPLAYTEYVEQYADEYSVPAHLIYAVILNESDFDSQAVSSVGAIGLMQLMPATFEDLTTNYLRENLSALTLYEPQVNIRYGVYYLHWLYGILGDWTSVLAAYNAGIGNVQKWLSDASMTDAQGKLLVERIPFAETQRYVTSVRKASDAYKRLYPEL